MQDGYEWDEAKSEANYRKHGIWFDAVPIFFAARYIEKEIAGDYGEVRRVAIGLIGEKEYTVIYTMRGENRRIISVRRARKHERELYWSE